VTFAERLDARLPHQDDWPALQNLLQTAHQDGIDVAAISEQLLAQAPLNQRPAQDLKYRLIARLDLTRHQQSPKAANEGRRDVTKKRDMPAAKSPMPPHLPNSGTRR
jgi:hypothetical protein